MTHFGRSDARSGLDGQSVRVSDRPALFVVGLLSVLACVLGGCTEDSGGQRTPESTVTTDALPRPEVGDYAPSQTGNTEGLDWTLYSATVRGFRCLNWIVDAGGESTPVDYERDLASATPGCVPDEELKGFSSVQSLLSYALPEGGTIVLGVADDAVHAIHIGDDLSVGVIDGTYVIHVTPPLSRADVAVETDDGLVECAGSSQPLSDLATVCPPVA